MKIAIDIDGVLTDEHSFIIDNGTKFFSEIEKRVLEIKKSSIFLLF